MLLALILFPSSSLVGIHPLGDRGGLQNVAAGQEGWAECRMDGCRRSQISELQADDEVVKEQKISSKWLWGVSGTFAQPQNQSVATLPLVRKDSWKTETENCRERCRLKELFIRHVRKLSEVVLSSQLFRVHLDSANPPPLPPTPPHPSYALCSILS